jgi:hypothetical protein
MNRTLSCYYLDEPLSPEERELAEQSLLGKNARFPTSATSMIEKRVPYILPIPGDDGMSSSDPTAHIQLIKRNLRKAGIRADGGEQVLFVLPKGIRWGAIFQIAIHQETGYSPFTLQRWYYDGDQPERREPRIVDVQGLMGGR